MPFRLERLDQQHVLDERQLDADFLALEVLDRADAGLADDHVAAVAVVDERDELARGAAEPAPMASEATMQSASILPAEKASIEGRNRTTRAGRRRRRP
jgi:hypothetical protein